MTPLFNCPHNGASMTIPKSYLTRSILSLLVLACSPFVSAEQGTTETEKRYYWEGGRLNNQSRLSDGMKDFETDVTKRKEKRTQEYLEKIRVQSLETRKRDAAAIKGLTYGAQPVDQALEVTRSAKGGLRMTLRLSGLFEENGTSLRVGAVDILDRAIAHLNGNKVTEVLMVDELDEMPAMKDISAERLLFVSSYLTMPRSEEL
jgi:hypothetical protein